jgi:hypothetical protein
VNKAVAAAAAAAAVAAEPEAATAGREVLAQQLHLLSGDEQEEGALQGGGSGDGVLTQ